MRETPKHRVRGRAQLVAATTLALAGAVYLTRPSAPHERSLTIANDACERRFDPAQTHGAPAAMAAAPEPQTELARLEAPLPLRDPGPVDTHDGPVRPHPMTPERDRIQRENVLLGEMNDAMDLADAAALRTLLARYEQEYPEDPNALSAGYHVILACLAQPGPEATAAAQRYFDEQRGSTLRRFVARHCLARD